MSASEVLSMAAAEGVTLMLVGDRLTWRSDHQPPADLLNILKAHRLELIAELSANDRQERRRHWSISVPGCRPFTMIGEPMTRAEALVAARWRWPDARVSR
jgi:hypothetical protein